MIQLLDSVLGAKGNATFNDHTGSPSAGRKCLAALVLSLVVVILAGLVLPVCVSKDTAASTLKYYKIGVGALQMCILGVAGFVYGGKAHAQANDSKAKAAALAAASTKPDPKKQDPPPAKVEKAPERTP